MIWVLDDSQDTLYQFLERLRQFALPAAIANGMQLDVAAEGEVTRMLLKEEKRNLLLVAKESVNNSIKYARCSRIVVRISTSGNSVTLRIADDGIGFDPSQPVEGNGLKNIRRRATKIHYTVAIDSAPGAGTRITLHKP
jgi:signal transduction histidine kinase